MCVYIDVLMLFIFTVITPGLDPVQPGNVILYTEGQMVSLHLYFLNLVWTQFSQVAYDTRCRFSSL